MKKSLCFVSLVLLLVPCLLTGCKSKTDTQNPKNSTAAEDNRDHSKLIFAVSEHKEAFYRSIIQEYCKVYPDVEIEVEVLSYPDNAPTEENEQKKNDLKNLQVQIMAGKGPDIFLLDDTDRLFEDLIKCCHNGVFLDLKPLLSETFEELPLNQTILDAGLIEEKQYFLPLGYSMWGLVVSEPGDWRPSEKAPAEFLQEVFSHTGSEADLYALEMESAGLLGEPVFDFEKESITFSEDLKQLLQLLVEQQSKAIQPSPEQELLQLGNSIASNAYITLGKDFLEKDPAFFPIPNGKNGVNAQVNLFAAVRANTPHASKAGDFLKLALSDKLQSVEKDFTSIPVNQQVLLSVFTQRLCTQAGGEEYQETCAEIAKGLVQATEKITDARFAAYENNLLYKTVFMIREEKLEAFEERLDNLQNELRFYFDE